MNKKKGTMEWLIEFAAPYKANYIISIILAIVGVSCSILPYWIVGKMIVQLFQGNREFSLYAGECVLIVLCWILRYIFHAFSTERSHSATFSVISEVRLRLAEKLTKVPMGYVIEHPSGSIKSTMLEKTMSIEHTLAHLVPELSANLLVAFCIIVYLYVLDWKMALVSLITIPLGLLCYIGMMRGYGERYTLSVEKNKNLNAVATEYINGIEVIKAFSQSETSYQKFTDAVKSTTAAAMDWMRSCQGYFSAAMTIFPATLLGVLPFGCLFYLHNSLSATTFIMTIVLSFGIMPPLLLAISYTDDLAKIGTIIGDISTILEQPDLKRSETSAKPKNYNILLDEVSFSYGKDEVLHDIKFEIPENSVTALVGPSGSGKSTIAKLIASMWDVTTGSIKIGGADIHTIALHDLNQMIAYVSQDNYLFDDTIRNNIRKGRMNATDNEVEEAAKKSGCHEFIMGLENGYETKTGGSGGHLSGGECQRISIARAMLKNAPIIILDEATAYLDPENEAVLQDAISKLTAEKTLIVIAHRLSTIIDSDKIVVVNQGHIDSTGTHRELLKNSLLYKEMWTAYNVDTANEGRDISHVAHHSKIY